MLTRVSSIGSAQAHQIVPHGPARQSQIGNDRVRVWYHGVIMMSRTQIALEAETQRRARQRANDLGVSLAEYLHRLVVRDLASPQAPVDVACIFDLGSSGGSDILRNKDSMIARAFHSAHKKSRHR